MAPKGTTKGKGKARAKMPTSVINRPLLLNLDRIQEFIVEHIRGLIRRYNVCGVKDERTWDLFYGIIFLDPVTIRHFSQFRLMWPHRQSRSSPIREWWGAFRAYMGQIFDKTRDPMNNWRRYNPRAFRVQVEVSNPQATSSGMGMRTSDSFSSYGRDDLRAKIEPPSCRQYKPGDFLAVKQQNWDEIIDEGDAEYNWADPRPLLGGRSRTSNGNDNDDGEGEDGTQGSEKGSGNGKGTKDSTWKGKGKGKENGKGKGIVKPTPGGDDISCAIALQLQKQMSEPDLDKEG
jgi:hypothetical protein